MQVCFTRRGGLPGVVLGPTGFARGPAPAGRPFWQALQRNFALAAVISSGETSLGRSDPR